VLAGLLSRKASALYDELVSSEGLPVDGPSGVATYQGPALAELSSHGLLWESAGPPRRVRAVSRSVALRRLISSRQRELAEAHRQLADHYLRLDELESLPAETAAPPSSGVEILRRPDQVVARLHDLIAGARRECRILQTDDHLGPLSDWPALLATARETTRFRVICTPGVLQHEATRKGEPRPADGRPARRVLPELPGPMVLFEEAAMVPAGDMALLVRAPALFVPLSEHFEVLWSCATPSGGGSSAPDDSPGPVELQILRLAATGLKDEAIARSLGRSSRWVRRHVETLEQRLGATNRLTLGIAAARRGWV
jgi:DNA-binding CsgD family transcriptional regulator